METLRPALRIFLLLTIITGVAYPLIVTAIAKAIFPTQAEGSLLIRHGEVIGSRVIGQPFQDDDYFWSRASATASVPYNASASGGSNLGPSDPALRIRIEERVRRLEEVNLNSNSRIPVDLVTASGSGLDPEISIAAALYQIPRIAKQRGIPEAELKSLVRHNSSQQLFGFLGEPTVNVLLLNLELDSVVNAPELER